MYILIKNEYEDIKSEIRKLIDDGKLLTWQFVLEDNRTRLMHIGDNNQYNDVVLRFVTSYYEGGECLKILPTIKNDATDKEKSKSHFGIVMGRFAEVLNNHFEKIGVYETVLQ